VCTLETPGLKPSPAPTLLVSRSLKGSVFCRVDGVRSKEVNGTDELEREASHESKARGWGSYKQNLEVVEDGRESLPV
jgi:hypothetical protein